MEINSVTKKLRDGGKVVIKEGNNLLFELIVPSKWEVQKDSSDGVFLLYDTFQIRTLSNQFSEVSLDVVEYANKPTIYHTPVNRFYKDGPIHEGLVKFSMVKHPFWNSLLYTFGQPLVFQQIKEQLFDFETREYFPLLTTGVKEIYLSPEGDIKILKS